MRLGRGALGWGAVDDRLVWIDCEMTGLDLGKDALIEIAAYRRILGALGETALGEGQSRELIATVATELYAEREDDHDDRA